MSEPRQRLGKWGEDAAAAYLQERGYSILERNFRVRRGEIDLVAEKEGALIFVEVKTRSSNRFAYPEQAVTARKQSRMLAAAEAYFERHPEGSATWQFDVLAITRGAGADPEIEHFENVIV